MLLTFKVKEHFLESTLYWVVAICTENIPAQVKSATSLLDVLIFSFSELKFFHMESLFIKKKEKLFMICAVILAVIPLLPENFTTSTCSNTCCIFCI